MKVMATSIIVLFLSLLASGGKIAGRGENQPTVQSTRYGGHYVRSVPSSDYGEKGTTKVFKVKRGGDELLNEYPVYMRGDLFLGWSPTGSKWCLVHLEPERITKNDEIWTKLGKISCLVFYARGKEIRTYTGKDLEKMGLKRRVYKHIYKRPGEFVVHGICQIPCTNHYVLKIDRIKKAGSDPETILLDITTGKIFTPELKKNADGPVRK
jgi:hypothetical protein